MNNLNSVIIEGVCTKDKKFEVLEGGRKRFIFTVGVERNIKNEYGEIVIEVSYITVKLYGNCAEIIGKILMKKNSQKVRVVGRLMQEDVFVGDKKVSTCYIVGEHIEFGK